MTVEEALSRVDLALAQVAAIKGRPPADEHAEAHLRDELAGLLGPTLERIQSKIADAGGIPTDELRRQALVDELAQLEDKLGETILEHTAGEARRGWAKVERKISRATKQLPDEIRPFGVNRKLFESLTAVRDRTVAKLIGTAADALTTAAGADNPTGTLRNKFSSLLDYELGRLTRHTLRDAHETAAVQAEQDFGIEYHQWVTAGDDKVRESHAAVDGEIVRVGYTFSNGWRTPGYIGCRCRVDPFEIPEGMRPPTGQDRFYESDLFPVDPNDWSETGSPTVDDLTEIMQRRSDR